MQVCHTPDFSKCKQQYWSHCRVQPGNIVTTPWGRGLGKSWFGREELLTLVSQWEHKLRPGSPYPGVRCVVLMPTLEQAKKVHGDLIQIQLEAEWGPLGGKVNRTTWRVTFPGGSWIQFVSAERAHLLRGIRCDVVFVDECDDVPTSIVNSVVIPWFSEPHSLRIQIRSGTPRMGRKGLLYFSHKKLPELLPGRAFAYHATGYDAPLIVSREAIEDARLTTPDAIFNREWLCDYDSAEGLVYPAFKEGFHVRPPPEGVTWDDVFICGDHGFSDPGVLLTCGVLGHGNDATMWVLDEVYETLQDPIWWFDKATERVSWYPRAYWFLDPSRPDMIKGYKGRGARIGVTDNDRASGIGCVQQMLKIRSRQGADGGIEESARLYVAPNCKQTINEFGLYRHKRDPRDPEAMTETVVEKTDHCFVAGTPVLTARGMIPIEDVTTSDKVLTRDGWHAVRAAGMTSPSSETWTLTMSTGYVIEATPDHRIFTVNRGFVRLDSLRYGDTLLPCKTNTVRALSQSSEVSDSGGTRIRQAGSCGSTSPLREVGDCTGRFTSSTSEQSPKVITSTTVTTTRSTIIQATSSASALRSMCKNTCLPSGLSGPESMSTGSVISPSNGTRARRGEPGTPNTEGCPTPSESQSPVPATSADRSTALPLCRMAFASAPTRANQRFAEPLASTRSTACAPIAVPGSESTSTHEPFAVHVVAVAPTGRQEPVFDLTISGPPEFFAHGVLVHNSMDSLRYGVVGRFFPDKASRRNNNAGAEARQ